MILILIAAGVIYLVIRRYIGQHTGRRESGSRLPVDTVRCMHCGTHLPKREALINKGEYYCSEEHMKAGRSNS